MADEILFTGSDRLTAEHIGEVLGREGYTNYVARGLGVTADYGAAVCDIGAGKVFVIHNGRDQTVLADARAGVPLATDGTNHVFITITETTQDDGSTALSVEYAVNQDGTDPGGTALKIAEIDMAAEAVEPINRTAPFNDPDATTYKGNDIDTDGDGVVDAADTANHIDAADVDGAVAQAENVTGFDPSAYLRNDQTTTLSGGEFRIASDLNVALRLFPGPDGSNTVPHTITYSDRGLRFYSDSLDDWVLDLHADGTVSAPRGLLARGSPVVTEVQLNNALFGFAEVAYNLDPESPPAEIRSNANANFNRLFNLSGIRIRRNSSNRYGADLYADFSSEFDAHRTRIDPVDDNSRTGDHLSYYHGAGYWEFASPLRISGNYFQVPKVQTDPDDPPNGAEWINTSDW